MSASFKRRPILLIHGGAGFLIPNAEKAKRFEMSLSKIITSAYSGLKRGGSALDAVTLAVKLLENDPLYNAGRGSKIQSDGVIRMSASIMDGNRRRFAGCINVLRVKNPVLLARKLLKEDFRVLEGTGAERYAREAKLEFGSPYIAARIAEFKKAKAGKSGTVGAIAIDSAGRLAAATSTGGRGMESPGRVSDTPTVAANFANQACAVSVTGTGEEIVEFGVAAAICALVEAGQSLPGTVKSLLRSAKKSKASFGLIAIDYTGKILAETTTAHLVWASATPSGVVIHP